MTTSERIIDISPLISNKLAVFPGDVRFKKRATMDFSKGHHLGLSSMEGTLHLGAHADAPNHYHPKGSSIDERDLSFYYGQCQVIKVNLKRGQRITPKHIISKKISAARILFKTDSYPDPDIWSEDFNSLSPELIEELAKKNVKLIGIDTPSIDPAKDKELKSHLKIYSLNMAILEGIVLDNVNEGIYKLVAFPLKIKGADASPVRAVLIRE